MDSLTQVLFGAAVGQTILGRRVGRRALFWGGLCGTLPDLDVFLPSQGAVWDFVGHRGFSHSLFVLALLSPLLAWLITRIHPDTKQHFRGWFLLVFVCLETSVILDYFTIYGTRLLWPFDPTPLAWSMLFIIDPFFTLPLLVGVSAVLFLPRTPLPARRICAVCLGVSLSYLVWAAGAKIVLDHKVEQALARQGVTYERLVSCPTPFNTFLWRFLGIEGDRFFEVFVSVFDGPGPVRVTWHPRRLEMIRPLEGLKEFQALAAFSRGFFKASLQDGNVVFTDLRMGSEPGYAFQFVLGRQVDGQVVPVEAALLPRGWSREQIRWTRQRIFNEQSEGYSSAAPEER